MTANDKIIRDVSVYSGSMILVQLITVVAAVLTRRFLGPVQMGVWSFVQVLLNYAEYVSLGTVAALALEIPRCQGKGDAEKAEQLKNTVFSFSVFSSIVVALLVVAYAFRQKAALEPDLFNALLIAAGLAFLQRMSGLMISLLRAYKQFSIAGRQMLYSSILNAVLIAILSFKFKLYGFMLAMALSFVFNIGFIMRSAAMRFKFYMDGKDLRSLIGLGVPMMIIALFSSFFDTIDRLMISHYLGLEALGLYSIALMAYTYINSIPNAVGIVMIPNIQEKYGQTDQMRDLRGYLQKAELFFSSWIPVLIALAWFLGPPLIRLILPKFEAGIPAMRFLILSGYFVALVQAYSQFVYVIRKHMTLLPLFSLSCLAAAAFNYIAIKKGLGIEGVAMATTLASFFHYSIIMLYASRFVFSLSEIIKGYFIVVVKFASMLLCFMVIERMISMPSPITNGLLGAAVFIGLFSPFLIQAEKKLGVLRQLRDKFIRK